MAPGLMVITPPDMLLEMGHSSTVARRNVPPSKSRAARLSCSRLNLCVDSLGQGASRASDAGSTGPAWMYVSPFGKASKTSFGTPKLSSSMSLGVTSIQSEIEKVPCSEKEPLSKERTKWQGLSPMVWIE